MYLFARILLVVSQDSLSDSYLMFRKMRVFFKLRFLVQSRSSWRIFKWFSRSAILSFNESVSDVCDVIFSVFSQIRDELDSPSLIDWIADFSTALIEFLMSTHWEDILFSTDIIWCSRFILDFSSMRILSSLIGLARVLVIGCIHGLRIVVFFLAFLKFFYIKIISSHLLC